MASADSGSDNSNTDGGEVSEEKEEFKLLRHESIAGSVVNHEWLDGMASQHQHDFFVKKSENLMIVHALMLSVSAGAVFSGNFVSFEKLGEHEYWKHRGQQAFLAVWCAAFFASLYGVLISVMFFFATHRVSKARFELFASVLGQFWSKLPFWLLHFEVLLMWIGMVAYVSVTYQFHFAMGCLAVCSSFILLFVIAVYRLVQAVKAALEGSRASSKTTCTTHLHLPSPEAMADYVYAELKSYCSGKSGNEFYKLSRRDFLTRFQGANSEMLLHLAGEAYEKWQNDKIKSLLREVKDF